MKNPPLFQTISVVIVLAVLHIQMKGTLLVDVPIQTFLGAVIVLFGAGRMLAPLVKQDETSKPASDDDVDLSA